MARPRKYLTQEEAQEANRIKTRERKKERNRLRRHAKLAIQALQVDPPKRPDPTTSTTESRGEALESETELDTKLSDKQAIAEQLVPPLSEI